MEQIENLMQANYSKMEFVCQQLLEHGEMTPEVKAALFDFQHLRKKISAGGDLVSFSRSNPLESVHFPLHFIGYRHS